MKSPKRNDAIALRDSIPFTLENIRSKRHLTTRGRLNLTSGKDNVDGIALIISITPSRRLLRSFTSLLLTDHEAALKIPRVPLAR